MNLLEEHAREKAGGTDEWRVFHLECFPKRGDRCLYVECEGAVCHEKYKSGPRKGHTNWTKLIQATRKVIVLPTDEHEQWCLEWERKTGKCQECKGSGQDWCGWSASDGNRYRPCSRCHSTGRAPTLEPSCSMKPKATTSPAEGEQSLLGDKREAKKEEK